MNIVVPIKFVPDLVEELEIDESGAALDTTWLRLIINEFDEHAIEQAILLAERVRTERGGGEVTLVAPEAEGIDDMLYTGSAKGADRLIKLVGDPFEEGVNSHALARALAAVVKELQPDLVLTGVQAHDDLDGSVGALLAEYLGMPYVGYIAGVTVTDGVQNSVLRPSGVGLRRRKASAKVLARKEYPSGLIAEMEVTLPAVLGIQASEEPPRYVPISRIRQAMKSVGIDEEMVAELDLSGGPTVTRMFQPEVDERATMIEGDEEEVAAWLVEMLQDLGVL